MKLTEVINDLYILVGGSVEHNIHKIEHIDSKRKKIWKRKKTEDRKSYGGGGSANSRQMSNL